MISPAPLVDAQQLPEDILRQVLELLNRRYGFQFRDSFRDMARARLGRRMAELGLVQLQDYYYRLLYDENGEEEVLEKQCHGRAPFRRLNGLASREPAEPRRLQR